MARILQQPTPDGSGRRSIGAVWLVVAAALGAVAAGGCGPIEAEPLENGPPYIGEVSPKEAIRQVRGRDAAVSLGAVRLYDPNREENLYVAWLGSNQGFISSTTTEWSRKTTLQRGTFHQYEEVSQDYIPCDANDAGTRGRETVWMYVSDRPFETTTNESVEAREGGYLVSHAWVLDYTCL